MTRAILEKYRKKFETAQQTKSKEMRLSLSEVQEFHLTLVELLLENSELREDNRHLRIKYDVLRNDKKALADGTSWDGGTFKDG